MGYAGGFSTKGPDGKVCYYYGAPDTVYERLGHGEVVQTTLSSGDSDAAVADLREFSAVYFKNFKKIRGFGMQRLDPQDSGPGYRNMIGLPGGMDSPLMKVIEEENVNGMKLMRGEGNKMKGKDASEDDVFNSVWIYDSNELPFYPAGIHVVPSTHTQQTHHHASRITHHTLFFYKAPLMTRRLFFPSLLTPANGVNGPDDQTAVGVNGPDDQNAVGVNGPDDQNAVGVNGPEDQTAVGVNGPDDSYNNKQRAAHKSSKVNLKADYLDSIHEANVTIQVWYNGRTGILILG